MSKVSVERTLHVRLCIHHNFTHFKQAIQVLVLYKGTMIKKVDDYE